jgi:hypothetical protein
MWPVFAELQPVMTYQELQRPAKGRIPHDLQLYGLSPKAAAFALAVSCVYYFGLQMTVLIYFRLPVCAADIGTLGSQ